MAKAVTRQRLAEAATGEAPPGRKSPSRGRPPLPVRTFSFEEIAEQWRRERPDLDLDSLLVNIAVTRLYRFFYGDFEAQCEKRFGIDHGESRLLLSLRRSGRPFAARPTDLCRALLVTSGAITKQVNRLVAKGLVERTHDPLHAGGFLIHLTQKGLKVANLVAEYLVDGSLISKAMTTLSPSERAQFLDMSKRLLAAVVLENEESFLPW